MRINIKFESPDVWMITGDEVPIGKILKKSGEHTLNPGVVLTKEEMDKVEHYKHEVLGEKRIIRGTKVKD